MLGNKGYGSIVRELYLYDSAPCSVNPANTQKERGDFSSLVLIILPYGKPVSHTVIVFILFLAHIW